MNNGQAQTEAEAEAQAKATLLMGTNSPFEPSADYRNIAAINWQVFRAHIDVGFSESQALKLTQTFFSTALVEAMNEDNG